MTKEEIIKKYEMVVEGGELVAPFMGEDEKEIHEMLKAGLSALRPITREQVKKVWRGKWIGTTDDDGCTWYECSRCEHDLDSLEDPNHFCPACGAPMTDEAVEIVMERLEVLGYGKDD